MYFLALVLAQTAAGASASAARPAECGLGDSADAGNVWERAKEPNLRRYCDLLASGTAKLVGAATLAAEVLDIADEADKLLPGRAAPLVLKGRALLVLEKAPDARAALLEARKRDERALDDPMAMLSWARASARTGHTDDAVAAYRAALPRASALALADRSAAAFEAGATLVSTGTKGLDDGIAMLRLARREAQDTLQLASIIALALALDRSGQTDEATAVLAARVQGDVRRVLADKRVADVLKNANLSHELHALTAFALEGVDAAGAKAAWARYLEGPGGKGPWAAHARTREAAAGRKGRGR